MTFVHKQDPTRLAYVQYGAGHQPRIMIEEILQELACARAKFPIQNIWVTLAALHEEAGELAKAVLELNFEPRKGVEPEDVYREAMQVAVKAIRVALDCDYKANPGDSSRAESRP